MTQTYQNWHLEKDADNILWLWLDKKDASANTLDVSIFTELNHILDNLNQGGMPSGIIFASKKKSGFIAGADIKSFTVLKNTDEAYELIRRGQIVFDRIESLAIPTVAMISGFCLGGGCELALACKYRVASEEPKTRIGLPEVLIGLHPGWGGSVRMPKLIGAPNALDLILSGRALDARKAYKLGVVDASVPLRQLQHAARYFILKHPKPHKPSFILQLTNYPLIRSLVGKMARTKLEKKIQRAHYPAPFAVLDNWLKHGVRHEPAMLAEARSLANLVMDDSARNLIRVFFLQERLKSLAKGVDFKAKHVHVIGAGTMGGDIAAWCALKGLRVTLQDTESKRIANALQRANKLFTKQLKLPHLVEATMDRLIPDIEGEGVAGADVVIEAIFEDLAAKQQLLKMIEPKLKADAIIATNTSSIPLDEMNIVMREPERLIGIHFFNPVDKMQLVEIVRGKISSQKAIKNAIAFVRQIDRLPLPVKSSPGFLVNRVLMPYLMEAMALFKEGYKGPEIDKAATDFGMPMGPIELADAVGLDICLSVAKNLTHYYGGEIPQELQQKVAAGLLGKKTGEGFYIYKNGKAEKPAYPENNRSDEIQARLILRMLNEAMACLREEVVSDGDLLDAGMIFGTGFAPFRGGPINYAYNQGLDKLKTTLESLTVQYGERFKADAGWAKPKEKVYEASTS